jgi:protein-L-isoaspartate(D-aspartate) O-methyltransferase
MSERLHAGRAIIALAMTTILALDNAAADPEAERRQMVREIEESVDETSVYLGKSSLSPPVMNAMATVPRHEFVPSEWRQFAYLNRPLPIGSGQTISQPYIVALMTDLAEVGPDAVVLEIGTGSGYQAAVLSGLVAHVYSIEILGELSARAGKVLERLGYDNITLRVGDGYRGWPEHAPYDAIVVTAAPEQVPQALIDQLKPGGRLVVPVGPRQRTQSLQVLRKNADGSVETRNILPVGFVPLVPER